MTYLASQLKSMYANVHVGAAPTAAQSAVFDQMAQLSRNGTLSDAAALNYIVNSADADTAVALQAYQFFTGKTPTAAGLSYLVNSPANTTDLNDAYYQSFSLENRYINFSQNLGILGEGAPAFQTTYAPLTFAQAVSTAYETIIGSSYALAAGYDPVAAKADIVSRLGYFQQVAAERMPTVNQDMAVKAAVVGYIMAEAIKADVGLYASATNAFLADLAPDGLAQYNNDMVVNYALPIGGANPAGHTIGLTPGIDFPGGSGAVVNTQGTASNDTYVGDNTTLTNDSINGAGGFDTLLVTNTGAGAYTATPSLTSVEQVQLSGYQNGATTLDLVNSTGVTTVVAQGGNLGTGPNDVGVASSVSVLDATTGMTLTADVDDSATGGAVVFNLKTDGATDTLGVVLRNTDTSGAATSQGLASLTANGIETLTITSLRATIANTTVDASDALSIGTLTDTAATKLVLTGDSAITLGTTASSLTALTTIDASAMTKAVNLGSTSVAFGTSSSGAAITTGSGDDLVSLNVGTSNTLRSIDLASGTDTLVLSGGAPIGGLTVVDLSAVDQVSALLGTANAAIQTGINNVDLRGLLGTAQITGTSGANSLVGTAGNDIITGGGGADILKVQGGVDTLVYTAVGQTGSGPSADGVLTGVDIVTGMGATDRIDLSGLSVAALNSIATTAEGSTYLTGTSGAVALIDGTYNAATGAFVAATGGPDVLFEYDTNGGSVGGVEAILLVGSNADITSLSSNGSGLFTFA